MGLFFMKVKDFLKPETNENSLRIYSFGLKPFEYSIKIALSPLPTHLLKQKSLNKLENFEFNKIISLCSMEYSLIEDEWKKELHHKQIKILIEDMKAPSYDQFLTAYEEIKKSIAIKENVLIHCFAGYGRSGSILAGIVLQTIYDYHKKIPHLILPELLTLIRTLDEKNQQSVESLEQHNALKKLELTFRLVDSF